MKITVNKYGQVVNIEDSTLVANSTYGNAEIILTFDDTVGRQLFDSFGICTLSAIRADSVQIDNLNLAKDTNERVFKAEIEQEWRLLEAYGSLQLSFELVTNQNKVFTTITVGAFVQENISDLTKEAADNVETKIINTQIVPLQKELNKRVNIVGSDDTFDKAYVQPSLNSPPTRTSYVIVSNGIKKSMAILSSDENGIYHIPQGDSVDSPITLQTLRNTLESYIKQSARGAYNGVAPLDEHAKVPLDNLPESVKSVVGKFDTKLDKLQEDDYNPKVYATPAAKGDKYKDNYLLTNSTTDYKKNSLLLSNENGDYIIPDAREEASPTTLRQLKKVQSDSMLRSARGAYNGVAPLDEHAKVPLDNLPDEITILPTELDKKVNKSSLGAADGVATLDKSGKIPAAQLPSFVDDVVDVHTRSGEEEFSEAWLEHIWGETVSPSVGKIYVVLDGKYKNQTFRWSGSRYTAIASSLIIGTEQGTAFDGAKGEELERTVDGLETSVSTISAKATAADKSANQALSEIEKTNSALLETNDELESVKASAERKEVVVAEAIPTTESPVIWIDESEDSILSSSDIVIKQDLGDDPTALISQKATTDGIKKLSQGELVELYTASTTLPDWTDLLEKIQSNETGKYRLKIYNGESSAFYASPILVLNDISSEQSSYVKKYCESQPALFVRGAKGAEEEYEVIEIYYSTSESKLKCVSHSNLEFEAIIQTYDSKTKLVPNIHSREDMPQICVAPTARDLDGVGLLPIGSIVLAYIGEAETTVDVIYSKLFFAKVTGYNRSFYTTLASSQKFYYTLKNEYTGQWKSIGYMYGGMSSFQEYNGNDAVIPTGPQWALLVKIS